MNEREFVREMVSALEEFAYTARRPLPANGMRSVLATSGPR